MASQAVFGDRIVELTPVTAQWAWEVALVVARKEPINLIGPVSDPPIPNAVRLAVTARRRCLAKTRVEWNEVSDG
jgi:hypothetical protein